MTDDVQDMQAYRQATTAFAIRDYETLIGLADRIPGMLYFNRRRGSLQLRDCYGDQLVASMPVPDDFFEAVAELPQVE